MQTRHTNAWQTLLLLAAAAGAAMRSELPEFPAALPAFTVKATVEVTMKDGSRKEYKREVEIDVRRADQRVRGRREA